MILMITRKELIADPPHTYREQNDLTAMSDTMLIAGWKRHGTHTGTWDWDTVEIREE